MTTYGSPEQLVAHVAICLAHQDVTWLLQVQFPVSVAPTSLSQVPLLLSTAAEVAPPRVPVLLFWLSAVLLRVSATVCQCLLLAELLLVLPLVLLVMPDAPRLYWTVNNEHTIKITNCFVSTSYL